MAPELCEPLVGSVPLQAPAPVHVAALVEVHVNVVDCPASIVVSDAVSETVGTGAGVTAPPPQADRSNTGPMIRRECRKRTPSQFFVLTSLSDRGKFWRAVFRSSTLHNQCKSTGAGRSDPSAEFASRNGLSPDRENLSPISTQKQPIASAHYQQKTTQPKANVDNRCDADLQDRIKILA